MIITDYYLGLDPGKAGGIAVLSAAGHVVDVYSLAQKTPADIAAILRERRQRSFAVLEAVHSTPQMGVVSAFSFGRSLGWLEAILAALEIPFQLVAPQRWQTYMQCRSAGDKTVTKARAQQLFPYLGARVTHATADALLLAEYGRRNSDLHR